jgi:hypothetical protein
MAKAIAKELFEPFGSVAVGLGRTVDGNFTIEVRFASDPSERAHQITEVRGFPIRICVIGKS